MEGLGVWAEPTSLPADDNGINYSVRNNSRVQSEGETFKLGSVPTQPDGSSHR